MYACDKYYYLIMCVWSTRFTKFEWNYESSFGENILLSMAAVFVSDQFGYFHFVS